MIYAAFSVYLLGIVFMSMGIYRLWAQMLDPRWVNWALLPGTVVSEMAYIFGCLITGGEVRRAKLMGGAPSGRRRKASEDAEAEPTTEAEPKLRTVGPILSAFATIVACGVGILIVHALLGAAVIDHFQVGSEQLARALPASTGEFWDQLDGQLRLLRATSATWLELDWLDWRVPLFVYLATCLSLRVAPVRRPLRATLAAVVVLAGIIALVGLVWGRFAGLMGYLWPLVTYLWGSLLFLLAVSLLVRGGVGLVRALIQSDTPAKG